MSTRLLLDARKLGDGGIGVYLENLVDGLISLRLLGEIDLEISLICSTANIVSFSKEKSPIYRWSGNVHWVADDSSKYSFSEYFVMPRRLSQVIEEHDIYHSPHYTLPFMLKIPSVVTVHDIIHVRYPDTFYHRPIAKKLIRSALKRANAAITVSEVSKRAICEQVVQKSFAPKIKVVHNALREGFQSEKYFEHCDKKESSLDKSLPDNYLLFVGSNRPHKRFAELLLCLKALILVNEHGSGSLSLAVIGGGFSKRDHAIVKSLELEDRVFFLGGVPTEDLATLYKNATAVMIPSLDEGFGLVALEAMSSETPVVSTPLPSIKEVCGDAVWMSDDFTGTALCAVTLNMLEKKDKRLERIGLGKKRAKLFTIEEEARETCKVYEEVIVANSNNPDSIFTSPKSQSMGGGL